MSITSRDGCAFLTGTLWPVESSVFMEWQRITLFLPGRRRAGSARRPPSSSSPPNAIGYALITQARPDWGAAEIALDGRERHVDYRHVQHDHQHPGAADDQREPAGPLVPSGAVRGPGPVLRRCRPQRRRVKDERPSVVMHGVLPGSKLVSLTDEVRSRNSSLDIGAVATGRPRPCRRGT